MKVRIGKFCNYMSDERMNELSDLKSDILWYLLQLTEVNRFFTKESFKEFLIRYFLITEIDLDKNASEFIEHGVLISGYMAKDYFEFTLSDLINFIGFSATDSKFNVSNSRAEFIQSYVYKAPNIKLKPSSSPDKPSEITTDALSYMFIGVINLLKIDSFTIQFKEDLKSVTPEVIAKTEKYVSYIVKQLPEGVFIDEQEEFLKELDWMEEFYDSSQEIHFDVTQNIPRNILARICCICYSEKEAKNLFATDKDDEDYEMDYELLYEHIKFAYGVKHGYISLSTDPHVASDVNPYFIIDYDLLAEEDGEIIIPTQYIYENWSVAEWIDLLP